MQANASFFVSTRNRVLFIIGVIALSLWVLYPPRESLKLGLDLSGGVQLVLRVKTEAVPREFRDTVVEQALRTIERRVNELGVAEAVITRYTTADRILVQLPGVSDVAQAKRVIKSTAQIQLTLVDRGPFASEAAALAAYGHALPPELKVMSGDAGDSRETAPLFYVVHRTPAVAGNDIRMARQAADEYGRPAVDFTLSPDAARRFADITQRNINQPLATVLDDRVSAVATIQDRIDGRGQISGLSRAEMIEQVINLNAGALPADMEYVDERTVGASLGAASVRAGVLASLGGLGLVLLFMLAYYRRAGINALISVVLNLLILLALMAYIPAALTLPGIAGLILTIGMGVDSNVLIFERIREELAAGQSPRSAVKAAFTRVWLTIVDTHVTSLIAAAVLFQFGTIPIRGFATTLAIGLLANVFTAVFVSRTLFELGLRRRPSPRDLSIGRAQLFRNTHVHVTRWRWHAALFSLLVVAAGTAAVVTRGLSMGIDFTGGTLAVVQFEQPGVTEEQVRDAVAGLPGDAVVQRYGAAGERQFQIRLPLLSTDADGLEGTVQEIRVALRDAGLPAFEFQQRELVSAMIGRDLQQRGMYAVAASIAAIAVFIGIRFRPAFAAGAIAATCHDILVTLACVSLAGYDLSLTVLAALLTIVGYSVNDTIVVFDRVRENTRRMSGAGLEANVNLAVNQTLARTVITAGATFLSVVALYALGGDALQGFAFTMLAGIVAGTYSTVFIASSIAIGLSGRSRRAAKASGPSEDDILCAR